jgi:hypothetical protein
VQLLDVLFAVFVLLGIEKLRIVHGYTAYNPFELYWMPYTHSLAGSLVWSILAGQLFWMVSLRVPRRERWLASAVLGAAVFSHFVLDVPMHTADMPLWPGAGAPKIGLGLWNHPFAAVLAELVILAAGGWIYLRGSRARSRFARIGTLAFGAFLVALTVSTPFQPDPTSARAFAVTALAAYFGLAILAALLDRGRLMATPR